MNYGKVPLFFRLLLAACFVSLFSGFAFSQRKLLEQVDSFSVPQNSYLFHYTVETFYQSGLAEQLIDPISPDIELLEAAVYFEINRWRKAKRRETYDYHPKLDAIAALYVNYYKKYRFRKNNSNYYRLKRTLKKIPKWVELDFSFIEGYVYLPVLSDYSGGPYYYNEELNSSELHLYEGYRSKKNNKKEKPIHKITYAELAKRSLNELLKAKSGILIRSKAYQLMVVRAAKLRKTTISGAMPRLKLIYLLGGYRNMFINEME